MPSRVPGILNGVSFINCYIYRWHFSRILISREKREIISHFSARNEKKREIFPPYVTVKLYIPNWSSHQAVQLATPKTQKVCNWTASEGRNIFTVTIVLWKIIKKCRILAKIGQEMGKKWRKSISRFSLLISRRETRISRSHCHP